MSASASSANLHPNANYILDSSGSDEIKRLSEQYLLVKAVFDNPDFLPPAVDRQKIHRVLDAAAGTASWILDLSNQPFASSYKYELWASDITLSKFPGEDTGILQRAGIRTFQQDLTQPFEEEMKGKFDLVHTSALVFALAEEGWGRMLRNVYEILAPGGYLVIADSDLLLYTAQEPPPPDGTLHDIEARMSGSSPIHSVNNIMAGIALERGFVLGLSYRLKGMLASAGFTVLSRQRALVPNGALLETQPSVRGNSLAQFRKPIPNTSIGTVTSVLLSQGKLEAPKGVRIDSEEGRLAFLQDARRAMDEGMFAVASEWVAQKPEE